MNRSLLRVINQNKTFDQSLTGVPLIDLGDDETHHPYPSIIETWLLLESFSRAMHVHLLPGGTLHNGRQTHICHD